MEKKVRNGNRYCQKCGHKLQKYGSYKNGSQKWYCPHCHNYIKIGKNHKKKQKTKLWLFKYLEYLTHSKKMSEYGCHRSTFWRNTKIFKNKNIFIPESRDRHLVIYLDGLRVNKKVYLIANNGKHVISFSLADHESQYVVCDGQNGLIKAIKSIRFNTKIQRC